MPYKFELSHCENPKNSLYILHFSSSFLLPSWPSPPPPPPLRPSPRLTLSSRPLTLPPPPPWWLQLLQLSPPLPPWLLTPLPPRPLLLTPLQLSPPPPPLLHPLWPLTQPQLSLPPLSPTTDKDFDAFWRFVNLPAWRMWNFDTLVNYLFELNDLVVLFSSRACLM